MGVAAAARSGPPSFIRTPLPTSPLSGGRSMNGSPPSPYVLPLPGRGRVGVGVAAAAARSGPPSFIRTPLPTSPLSGGRSVNGSPPSPYVLPLPGRGRVGVGVAAAGRVPDPLLHPDPPPDLPPVRGEGREWLPSIPLRSPSPWQGEGRGGGRGGGAFRTPSFIRTPLPTSPLSGGRSVNGSPPSPYVLPLPGRGRVGVGVAAAAARSGPPPSSGPPSRPPPCQGGGV